MGVVDTGVNHPDHRTFAHQVGRLRLLLLLLRQEGPRLGHSDAGHPPLVRKTWVVGHPAVGLLCCPGTQPAARGRRNNGIRLADVDLIRRQEGSLACGRCIDTWRQIDHVHGQAVEVVDRRLSRVHGGLG